MTKIEESMLVIASTWNESPTFKLIAATNECPYVEAIYDPENKVLAVVGRQSKEKAHMMIKLDNSGRPKTIKGKNNEGQIVEMNASERVIMDTFYEYYIEEAADIKNFIGMFAINKDHKAVGVMNDSKAKVEKKTSAKKK